MVIDKWTHEWIENEWINKQNGFQINNFFSSVVYSSSFTFTFTFTFTKPLNTA